LTRFKGRRSFLDRNEVRQAGGRAIPDHRTPTGVAGSLNASIAGEIDLIAEFR